MIQPLVNVQQNSTLQRLGLDESQSIQLHYWESTLILSSEVCNPKYKFWKFVWTEKEIWEECLSTDWNFVIWSHIELYF